jgi:O-antigen ligase
MQFNNHLQRITLYIFFFSINFEMFVPFNSIGISLSRFTGILYFLTIIPDIKFFIKTDRIGNILILSWLFFGLLTLMSLLNINEVSKDFFDFSVFQNILLFWFLVNHARKDYLILEKGMLFFALGSIVLSIMYILGYGVVYYAGRLSMFDQNINTLGVNMCIGIIILLLSVLQNKAQIGRIRYYFLAFLPVMINFIFATGSRKAFISLILCLFTGVILIRTIKKSNKLIALSVGIICLIILGTLLMQSDVMRERLLQTAREGEIGGREEIWRSLLPIIKENPLFGVGQTGYNFLSIIIFGWVESPHNVILEVICLTGFAGLLIYVSYLILVFIRGYEVYRRSGLLLPLLLIIPVSGLILGGQILLTKIGWIIFAYMVGSTAIKSNVRKNLQQNILYK